MEKVSKHWGFELWIADGKYTPYALKKIYFKAGNRTSLQVHKYKFETCYVLSGNGILLKSNQIFDIDNFLRFGMSLEELEKYEKEMTAIELSEGMSFHTEPGYVHRVIAKTDLEFIEASTKELDDVIRLHDDAGRTHGKIESEHN